MPPNADESTPNTDDTSHSQENLSKESYERRREQVRRAQKIHRARKASYVKSLESEIDELRKQNAILVQETRDSKSTIRRLQHVLTVNGLDEPDHCSIAAPSEQLATISITTDESQAHGLQARLPPTGTSWHLFRSTFESSQAFCPQSTTTVAPDTQPPIEKIENIAPTTAVAVPPDGSPAYPYHPPPPRAHPQGLDSPQVGIDFVLALEQPCLSHHRMLSTELLAIGSIGTGHQTMLSTPIMARAPLPPPPAAGASLDPLYVGFPTHAAHQQQEWAVPAAELERLLEYSHQLGLEKEVTPVQVWQAIRRHEGFHGLSFGGLEAIREALLGLVDCYGFGAVIDRASFERVVSRFLAPGYWPEID